MGGYRKAEICLNGHTATSDFEYSRGFVSPHCSECGAETIRECPPGKSSIRGHYHVGGVFGWSDDPVPAYCHSCGDTYPWTQPALGSARGLV